MTDCTEYRRRITAEPELARGECSAHAESCVECAAFTKRLLAFEARLAVALKVELPPASQSASNVVQLKKRPRGGSGKPWLAMAASVVVAVGVAAMLWVATAESSLASDVVKHMKHEPDAWASTDSVVASTRLDAILTEAHVRLLPNMSRVSYAQSCFFRNHDVPHLVVQTDKGPVTVMVLAHENLSKAERFNEQGYRGMIVPMPGHGSVAIITRGASAPDTERVVANLVGSIQWVP